MERQTKQHKWYPAESRSPTGVGVTVTTSAPVTRQITNTDVDAVIVTLTWPQIQVAEDNGDIKEILLNIKYNFNNLVDMR